MNQFTPWLLGGLVLLPILALAQEPEKNPPQSPVSAYFFREVIQNLMTTQPDRLIKEHASFVNARQRDTMAKKDDVFFEKGVAQLFAFKNLGRLKFEWTGRSDKRKTKLLIAYWDGKQFVPTEFSVRDAVRSYSIMANRPPTEEQVHFLVYCPDHPIMTDAALAELVSDITQPGL